MFKKGFLLLRISEIILKLVAYSVTEFIMTGLSTSHAYTFTHFYVNSHTHTHTHTHLTTLTGTGNIMNFRSRKVLVIWNHIEEWSFSHIRKTA
jgi:hypothetical protein